MPSAPQHAASTALALTHRWLERAVIGLNLCPFAKAVYVKEQVRYAVCEARDEAGITEALERELRHLAQADPQQTDTTLMVLTQAMADFFDFHVYTQSLPRLLKRLRLRGELQIATFHPQFQFAGTEADDVTNLTNRAPYPTLHLLREASIARAVASFPDPESIYGANVQRLTQLGHRGWQALFADDPAAARPGSD